MNWIYLSPHLDDVALSCGGLAWEQVQRGEAVQIWTICAGDPPDEHFSAFADSLHARWDTSEQAARRRREEDLASCARLGAQARHLALPDCIYRRAPGAPAQGSLALYASEQAIFGELHPSEEALVTTLAGELAALLPPQSVLVCPLALGGHVDHRLTRRAAEEMGQPLVYYADYPYALSSSADLQSLQESGWLPLTNAVSAAGLRAWQQSVAEHHSQISTFWPDLAAMRQAIAEYHAQEGGVRLWQAHRS